MIELSEEARKKLEEAFVFAARELLGKGMAAVVVVAQGSFGPGGIGGVVIRADGLQLKTSPPAKGAGIPGTPEQVANAELLRILKTKKQGGA